MGTRGFDKATVTAIRCAGIEGAGHLHGAAVEAAEQDDLAVLLAEGLRLDHAGVVDHGLEQGVASIGGEQYLAAVGFDQLMVFHHGIDHGLIDLHVKQAITGKIQGDRIASGQGHGTLVGDDDAVVAHRAAEQGDAATVNCADVTLVDDAGVAAVALEFVVAGGEIAVADVQRGGHQAADIDLCASAEQHAIGVDQEHPAIGIELAHDLRAIGTQHAVQRNRVAAGLVEGHFVAGGNIEALPVDGQFVAGLVDDHLVGAWCIDLATASCHIATAGQVCSDCGERQQQGRGKYRTCALTPPAGALIGNGPGGEAWVPDKGVGAVHV